ncbi:MAG: YdcF family protein [Acidobacteriaceae bacterium]|nr:YdcF family protein [Acidobacteriaceae bacterium]
MIVPDSNLRNPRSRRRRIVFGVLVSVLLIAVLWSVHVYREIADVAARDEAQPADAIAVFGAAEYLGRPSPVLHARLDHAVDLYRRQTAPLIITLGGGKEKDSGNTEGAVGRDYLLANGVPFANIIAETSSFDTGQQVHRLAAIARDQNLRHIVVVSDATHLFRIRELCRQAGLDVYTSPRAPVGHISNYDLAMRYLHEIVTYTASRLHLNGGWFEG